MIYFNSWHQIRTGTLLLGKYLGKLLGMEKNLRPQVYRWQGTKRASPFQVRTGI